MTKNWKKTCSCKTFFGWKIAIYLSLGLQKGCTSYRRSLYPSKENIQHFKTYLWVIFALLDPDPDPATQINAYPCGSGSGSTTLLDTQQVTQIEQQSAGIAIHYST
jgi:hypothetical protein